MKLLIIEGNPKEIWKSREANGGVSYHHRFSQLLDFFGFNDNDVVFPSEILGLPSVEKLKTYDGILLTGISLNIYNDLIEIERQLDFVEQCFFSGAPIYGSCWGMQVAIRVAGGKVGKSKNAREFGIAKNITLTNEGAKSVFYKDKPRVFDAYCIHEDDIHTLPENTEILAQNEHSAIQALQLHYKKSTFFGVQYHPEFKYEDIDFLSN